MQKENIKNWLATNLNIRSENIYYQLTTSELYEHCIRNNEGKIADNGSLVTNTGIFTGRSPKDKYIVQENTSKRDIYWGEINKGISENSYEVLFNHLCKNIQKKDKIYVRDQRVCSYSQYSVKIRIITTLAWHNLFCKNLFIDIKENDIKKDIDFVILCDPTLKLNTKPKDLLNNNFTILNIQKRKLLIGGTGYAGEMKKGIFSYLNYLMPLKNNVLSMHCAANIDSQNKHSSIFFGLSGTGKTTLSSNEHRIIVGDDEHCWSNDGIFNIEGGCYAKTINLSSKNEPQIFQSIKFGSILENTPFKKQTREVDFKNSSITENTRTAYPINYLSNITKEQVSPFPNNIFFLTCDAYGVLPPISKLEQNQIEYYFLLGYTAKVAGTEMGIKIPLATFSACFGEAFLPLNPKIYSKLLQSKINQISNIKVWLVNTGWIEGPSDKFNRIPLNITRQLVNSAMKGDLDSVEYEKLQIFDLKIPRSCPNIDSKILNPQSLWKNKASWDIAAKELKSMFDQKFNKYI